MIINTIPSIMINMMTMISMMVMMKLQMMMNNPVCKTAARSYCFASVSHYRLSKISIFHRCLSTV